MMQFTDDQLTAARQRVNLLQLAANDVELRESGQHSGEFRGPCPFCQQGDDRFVIFTESKDGRGHSGRFKCRVCGKRGDGLQYLAYKTGQPFPDVVKQVLGDDFHISEPVNMVKPAKPKTEFDAELWVLRLEPMLYHALDYLVTSEAAGPTAARQWLAHRGIGQHAIGTYGLGYNPHWQNVYGDYRLPPGLLIPRWERANGLPVAAVNVYLTAEFREKYGKRRFLRGSRVDVPFGGHLVKDGTQTLWVTEGELDAALLASFLPAGHVAISYGGADCMPSDWTLFDDRQTFLCFDNDEAGQRAIANWLQQLPGAIVARVPMGKDVTEFWQMGGDMSELVNNFFLPMPY